MKIRPYLTYQGTCSEAIELYKKAFRTEVLQLIRFSDLVPNPDHPIPDGFKNHIVQATMKFGDDFIRLSDCPGKLNDPESERISLAIETSAEEVSYAFSVLAQDGRIAIPLAETFYSPCAGVVFDKFGIMWNFIAH